MDTEKQFTLKEIKRIKDIKRLFPESELFIYYATPEQIQQIKSEGLSGISRKQRKD